MLNSGPRPNRDHLANGLALAVTIPIPTRPALPGDWVLSFTRAYQNLHHGLGFADTESTGPSSVAVPKDLEVSRRFS